MYSHVQECPRTCLAPPHPPGTPRWSSKATEQTHRSSPELRYRDVRGVCFGSIRY